MNTNESTVSTGATYTTQMDAARKGIITPEMKIAQKIYFHGARVGHKVDALRACDKVCFTVYGNETIKEEDWAPFVQSVVVFGRCHLVESGARATTLLKRFAMKYYPSEQLVDEEIAHAGKAVQIFEIDVEYLSGKEIQER